MKHPSGIWIWQLSKIRRSYLQALVQAKCERIYLKVLDDATDGIFWGWQCNPEIIREFKDNGIQVWGWGYIFDQRSQTDTDGIINAIRRAIGCGLDGFVFDVEQEVKNPSTHHQLKEILTKAKQVIPPGCMGYTSYGAPKFHPEVPWSLLNECCDLQFPQIYYEKFEFVPGEHGATENAEEVEDCLKQHQDLGLDKPILPIWGSESDSKHPSSVEELQSFIKKYPGSSVWRCPNAGERGMAWQCTYNHVFETVDPEPLVFRPYQPAPLPLPLERVLKLGHHGDDVYRLICALTGLGYLKKKEQIGESFDLIVDAGVRAAQDRLHVEIDGIVGPITKVALESALKRSRGLVQGPIAEAGGFNGAKFAMFSKLILEENIPWSRDIKFIQPFIPDFGNGSWHWCGATVYWLINEFLYKPNHKSMELKYPGMRSTFALVEACQQYFQKQGWYQDNRAGYIPPAGAIVIFDWDQINIDDPDNNQDSHIGIFLHMNGDLFVCAEGNIDRKGDENPNGVLNGRTGIRERERYLIQGFGVIPEGWVPT